MQAFTSVIFGQAATYEKDRFTTLELGGIRETRPRSIMWLVLSSFKAFSPEITAPGGKLGIAFELHLCSKVIRRRKPTHRRFRGVRGI